MESGYLVLIPIFFLLRAARKKKWPGGETRNGAQSFIVKFAKLRAS